MWRIGIIAKKPRSRKERACLQVVTKFGPKQPVKSKPWTSDDTFPETFANAAHAAPSMSFRLVGGHPMLPGNEKIDAAPKPRGGG